MQAPEAIQAARLALLEGALLAILREGGDDFDGVSVEASVDEGQTVIDLTYTHRGVPITGQSL